MFDRPEAEIARNPEDVSVGSQPDKLAHCVRGRGGSAFDGNDTLTIS
jgi:hypothetical protein